MKHLSKLHYIIATLLIGILLFPVLCLAQSLPPKVLFDGAQIVVPWAASTTEGASHQNVADGIQFTIDAWQEGKDMWPRLRLSGSGIDFSEYTHVIFEIANPTDEAESLAFDVVGPLTARRVVQTTSLAPRSTSRISLDISAGAPMDQSKVVRVDLYRSRPHQPATYLLKKITVIQNPDYIPARPALQSQLTQAQEAANRFLRDTNLTEDERAKFDAAANLIRSAQGDFDQAKTGYITAAQTKLDTSQQDLAQLGMILREGNSLIWTSPLGLAIRNNTLPEPAVKALTRISERLCLNEYQPVCVNVSAAAQAQTIQVSLDAKAIPAGLIQLRPTLFAKARDGSLTADAIGLDTSHITLQVEPFQTQQFIVWVNTKLASTNPGKYTAALHLTSPDKEIPKSIPIEIDVADIRLNSTVPVNVLNWAYFYQGFARVTEGLEKEAVANLRDYGVNAWMVFYDQVPLPLLDKSGKYLGLDTKERNRGERFNQILELLGDHPDETVILALGFQRPEARERLSHPGVLQKYLKDLHALLDQYHISLDKRYIQFWDEPQIDQVQESLEWMKKVRAADPTFKFLSNTSYTPEDPNMANDFSRYVDRWIPNWDGTSKRPDGWERAESLDIPHFGFYRCLTSRNIRGVNIYEYYRLMSWKLMQNGYDSVGFWTYNSGLKVGADEWDGTTGSSSAGLVVYRKDDKLLTSRRWELFREGLEDYKLAQAAFGNDGILNAKENPALMNFCRQVTEHPEEFREANDIRKELIELALKHSTR